MACLRVDHLVICAENLATGVGYVEDILGLAMSGGGAHPQMGTHNRLLSLGPTTYLEVIAIDPAARPPECARWFDLDRFAGPPRLSYWVTACDDLGAAVARAPDGIGDIMAMSRGDLHWQMAVPGDGRLPFDGAYPGLISWGDTAHPASRLPDQGARLELLEIIHPQADKLRGSLGSVMANVTISPGTALQMVAHIRTEPGIRILGQRQEISAKRPDSPRQSR